MIEHKTSIINKEILILIFLYLLLGTNNIISENYTIIATGSIVTKSINEPNTIVAGIPAKQIKKKN